MQINSGPTREPSVDRQLLHLLLSLVIFPPAPLLFPGHPYVPPGARLQLCAVAASQPAFVVSELIGTAAAVAVEGGGKGDMESLIFFYCSSDIRREMVRDACKTGQRCLAKFHPIRLLEHAAAVALSLRSCPDEWRVSHADGKPVGLARAGLACSCSSLRLSVMMPLAHAQEHISMLSPCYCQTKVAACQCLSLR